jgi:hypothetical protein
MRIIVNHLTRMQPGYICVAGVDVSSGQHVRPELRGRLTTDLLTLNGGPFDIASLFVSSLMRCSGNCFSTSRGIALHRYSDLPSGHSDAGVWLILSRGGHRWDVSYQLLPRVCT